MKRRHADPIRERRQLPPSELPKRKRAGHTRRARLPPSGSLPLWVGRHHPWHAAGPRRCRPSQAEHWTTAPLSAAVSTA